MIQGNVRHGAHLKTFIFLATIMLGIFFIIFSYYHACKDIQTKNQVLLFQEKEEITEALQQLHQLLNLTEARLINSSDQAEKFPSILSLRVEHLTTRKAPEILNLTFISASDPTVAYSRVGKTTLANGMKLEKGKNAVTYLGKGEFKLEKTLYDSHKKALGFLQVTFSIRHLLYKHFSENEIRVLPENRRSIKNDGLSFNVAGLPYIFVLNHPLPSFGQFLLECKFQIFLAFILSAASLIIGMSIIALLNKKRLMKYRLLTQSLKKKLKEIEGEKIIQTNTILAQQNLLQLKDHSKKETALLFAALQERYRQMAGQAHAINLLTSKLILEEAGKDKLMQEIHSVSQEGNTILRRLIDGYPMRGIEENIDILSCIDDIKALFLPEITEKNVKIEIMGKIKAYPNIDKMIFQIILHNIFHMLMGRLIKKNVIKIDLKDADPLQLIFYDDGYDVENKVYQISNTPGADNILCLDKQKLKEFISYLGWEISFQTEGEFLNSIVLSIPLTIRERILPDNVVNLFDFKPHVQ